MDFSVRHQNGAGNVFCYYDSIGYLAFCKHLAFAGLGPYSMPPSRFLGDIVGSWQYWRLNPQCFSLPNPFANDPTEKAFLSNRVGKAFADYLAKQLYAARFTYCYEDAMCKAGFSIMGSRPDFYCDDLTHQFAIEAKGFSCTCCSDNQMNIYKHQSTQGPLGVNFSIASVAYDLYREPKVKFYDPVIENLPYNIELNDRLRSAYYEAILNLIEELGLETMGVYQDNNNYVEYNLLITHTPIGKILLHQAIVERGWHENDWLLNIETEGNENYYIDRDGVGLAQVNG